MNIRAIFFTLALCVIGVVCRPAYARETDPAGFAGIPATLHIYLLIGQSNMAGRAPFEKEESGVIARCYVLNHQDEWEAAKNPLNLYSTIRKAPGQQQMGPGYTFAKTMLDTDKTRSLGLVVNARGGTSIKEWVKGTDFYNEAVRRTRKAMETGELKGVLWHQGESDSRDVQYLEKLAALIADLRNDLGRPELPFIVGQLFYNPETKANTKRINEELAKLPTVVPFSGCAMSDGLSTMDNTHFDTKSMRILGRRYAEEMIKVQKTQEAQQQLNGPIGFATDLYASDFGVKADGKTDDGPAIIRMVEAARKGKGPIRLVFPETQILYAATGTDRYLFQLSKMENISIDGGGSTFLLHPDIRFADLDHARHMTMKNFNVDFITSMFIETVIEALDPKRQFVDVRLLQADEANALGGPTRLDGEQWFGGFVWCENGMDPKAATHYSVRDVMQLPNGLARIFYGGGEFSSQMARRIKSGVTRFSVPRPGVAHRHGPGPLFNIHDTVDARLENIAVWGAPWFVFSIYRTEGTLEFVNVDVVPRPGTDRLMSACRDAFHVTGNRAKLVFDGCDTAGLGDDDYNFCVLSSIIREVLSPTEIVLRQKFPIQYNPMRIGETLMVMNKDNAMIGSAAIATYDEKPRDDNQPILPGGRHCPEVTVTLQTPIAGLEKGLTVWSKEAANPDTTMRNCTASFSIRMQTSLTIERCKLVCYNVAYGEGIEGPGPEFIHIADSEILIGRGAGLNAQSGGAGPIEKTRIQEIVIKRCIFRAPLTIRKARTIVLKDNRFYGDVTIGKYEKLEMTGNTRKDEPFNRP